MTISSHTRALIGRQLGPLSDVSIPVVSRTASGSFTIEILPSNLKCFLKISTSLKSMLKNLRNYWLADISTYTELYIDLLGDRKKEEKKMMTAGIEPSSSCLICRRSNQLSYLFHCAYMTQTKVINTLCFVLLRDKGVQPRL